MVLEGLHSVTPALLVDVNPYQHMNNKPVWHNCYHFSGYRHFHDIPDEPGLFDEPYGYEHGDDPFDNSGKVAYPLLILTFGMIALAHFMHAHFRFDNK